MKRDGTWHAVRVNVNAPGSHVRYRNGYYAAARLPASGEGGSATSNSPRRMHSDNPGVELPIAVETALFRSATSRSTCPIPPSFPPSALDWAQKHGRRQAEFDFAAEVRAVPSGQIVAQLRDTINVHLDQQRFQQVHQTNLVYQGGVVLSPGTYQLKFVARENESGKIGTFEQNSTCSAARRRSACRSARCCSRASLCRSKNHPTCRPGRRACERSSRLRRSKWRARNRAQRDAILHSAADAVCFLPGVLSGKVPTTIRRRLRCAPG